MSLCYCCMFYGEEFDDDSYLEYCDCGCRDFYELINGNENFCDCFCQKEEDE